MTTQLLQYFRSDAAREDRGLLTLNKTLSRTLSNFLAECQGCSGGFLGPCVLANFAAKKNAQMGKTKSVEAFGEDLDRFLAKLQASFYTSTPEVAEVSSTIIAQLQ